MPADLSMRSKPAWAGVDTDWYQRVYQAHLTDIDPTKAAIESFYHTKGTKLRHSPNPYFDENWYLQAYPDVAKAVRDGNFTSGFEHYGLTGHKSRSPHWLFSESFYLQSYADLTADLLAAGHYFNGYDHYLRCGDQEFRSGHLLFNPAMHKNADLAKPGAASSGEFKRFLNGDRRVASLHRLSWYFDPVWYLATYPDVATAIADGLWSCALEHYLCNETPRAYNPSAHFSEEFYHGVYPDIHPLLADGRIRNCFEHFLRYGAVERRSPTHEINLQEYFRAVTVQTEIEQGHFRDSFAHYESTGGKARQAPGQLAISEEDGKKLYTMQCENLLPALARHGLDFRCTDPAISVIIVACNKFAFTMATLASLRANYAGPMQVILIDNGSRDEIGHIEDYVAGLDIIRYRHNSGFVDACNDGLQRARADTTLYLNNDVQLNPGAIDHAMRRLWASETTGAVGGKIIRSHGKLQEAGSIIWRDGWASGYLRDADPNVAEANFVRAVDFCSGAFLLCKTIVLLQLNGFDTDYRPAYFEEADLCIRMRGLGFATIYDPSVSLIHYEYSTTDSSVSARMMERNHPIFRRKNADFLRRQSFNLPTLVTAARAVAPGQRRILFIEDRLPFRHLGSGFTRSNDIVHAMAALGYHVTLYPIYKATETISTIYRSFPETVEVIYDREFPDLDDFITARSGYFDALWIARTHNAERLAPVLARCAASLPMTRVVLDTEAIASSRTAVRDKVLGMPPNQAPRDVQEMTRDELNAAFISQRIVAVNQLDADLIKSIGFGDVEILGHVQTARQAPPGWESRHGLLFLASIPDEFSPNLDALSWFSAKVLPILDSMLPPDAKVAVAGNIASKIDLSLLRRNRRVEILGRVDDLAALYDRYRVFIAPTRFAGGIPYKIHEAAAHGIPIVASKLLCHQVGWTEGKDIASASIDNPQQFADAIVGLYANQQTWTAMQASALERIRNENAPAHYTEQLAGILSRVFA